MYNPYPNFFSRHAYVYTARRNLRRTGCVVNMCIYSLWNFKSCVDLFIPKICLFIFVIIMIKKVIYFCLLHLIVLV